MSYPSYYDLSCITTLKDHENDMLFLYNHGYSSYVPPLLQLYGFHSIQVPSPSPDEQPWTTAFWCWFFSLCWLFCKRVLLRSNKQIQRSLVSKPGLKQPWKFEIQGMSPVTPPQIASSRTVTRITKNGWRGRRSEVRGGQRVGGSDGGNFKGIRVYIYL